MITQHTNPTHKLTNVMKNPVEKRGTSIDRYYSRWILVKFAVCIVSDWVFSSVSHVFFFVNHLVFRVTNHIIALIRVFNDWDEIDLNRSRLHENCREKLWTGNFFLCRLLIGKINEEKRKNYDDFFSVLCLLNSLYLVRCVRLDRQEKWYTLNLKISEDVMIFLWSGLRNENMHMWARVC